MPGFVSNAAEPLENLFQWVYDNRAPAPETYLRGMTWLEHCWQQAFPDISFKVMHDVPHGLPGTATRTAIGVFAALQESEPARRWFAKHIRNAVLHCAPATDAISVQGDTIHFYEVKELAKDLGGKLFDRLTETQRNDFSRYFPSGREARGDFAKIFDIVVVTHSDEDHVQSIADLVANVREANQGCLVLTTSVEVNSPSIADEWTERKNARRRELIDKKIQRTITAIERQELEQLQRQAIAFRDKASPLPIDQARQLHQELLEKKKRHDGQS
jgi:hypothetical protein